MQVLYVDTLFALNFAMNFLSLFLCASVLHLRRRIGRLLAAATLGGLFAVLLTVLEVHILLQTLFMPMFAVLLCLLAFRPIGHLRRGAATVFTFYILSLLLGGCVNMLYEWMYAVLGQKTHGILRMADAVLLLGFASAAFLYGVSRYFGQTAEQRSASVTVSFLGKSVVVPMLIDSGCLLCDPISGKPAVIVRLESVSEILPHEILACARSQMTRMPATPSLARRCRLLPTRGLGEERLLLSIRPDRVTVEAGEKGAVYECDALIALIDVGRNYFGGFEGLLPSAFALHSGTA